MRVCAAAIDLRFAACVAWSSGVGIGAGAGIGGGFGALNKPPIEVLHI